MTKTISAAGFAVTLALAAIALIGFPQNSDVMAQDASAVTSSINDQCGSVEVALDEGYGVSRRVHRPVCQDASR